MAHAIIVPRLGWSMEEGTFVRWLKRDGDTVRRGEALYELEGDKAIQEIESVDDGVLRIPPHAPQPGSDVLVGTTLGYLVVEGEPLPWPTALAQESKVALDGNHAIEPHTEIDNSSRPGATNSDQAAEPRHTISPRAKRIASELGIDWTQLTGSGADGRIRERDVRAAMNSGSDNSQALK